MYLFRYCIVAIVFAVSVNADETVVLYANSDEKAVRIASLKLQLNLEENSTLEHLLVRNKLTVHTRTFGPFFALTLRPIRSVQARTDIKVALGSHYPGMFFVDNTVRHRQPASSDLHRQAEQPKPIMRTIDWVWLMTFLLALTGLIASVIQRKKIFIFKQEQTRFKDNQTQMDQEIETLQGEKHE